MKSLTTTLLASAGLLVLGVVAGRAQSNEDPVLNLLVRKGLVSQTEADKAKQEEQAEVDNKPSNITLKDPSNELSTLKDITSNPKNLKFRELEAAMLPRTLDEVDLALINTNYALAAGLNPTKDALLIEDKDSPYVNYLVARPALR